jgi:DNA-directed RNA polymerase specialized sigma24 family protein
VELARKKKAIKRPPSKLAQRDTNVLNSILAPQVVDRFAVAEAVELFQRGLDLLRTVERVGPRQAEALEFRVFSEMSIPEIVTVTGSSAGTVKRDLAQAGAFFTTELGLPPKWLARLESADR